MTTDKLTGYSLVLHAHDHIWRSDWPLAIRIAAMTLIWMPVCRGEL